MTWRKAAWAITVLVFIALLSAAITFGTQAERGSVSFPKYVPPDEGSRGRPVWIDASEVLTPSGTLRSPGLAEIVPRAASMLHRAERDRQESIDTGECHETGVSYAGRKGGLPLPLNIVDLEVQTEAIIHGRVVGMKAGFLRGRGVSLYEIEVVEVLKGGDVAGTFSSVFLFWPEARFDFASGCIEWVLGGWLAPPPEVGREVLLTPRRGVLDTIASRPVIIAWDGAEIIYEVNATVGGPLLQPVSFPEVYSATSIRELELFRRLKGQRERP